MLLQRLVEEDINGNELSSVWLRPEFPDDIIQTNVDLGFPEVSVASYDLTEGNGVVDLTRFHKGSTVTMDLVIMGPDKSTTFEQIRALCHPYKRPYLYLNRPEWSSERKMQLRANPMSCVLDSSSATRWKVSLSFSNPSGRMQAVTSFTSDHIAAGGTSSGLTGIVLPTYLPIIWPAALTDSHGEVIVRGSAPVQPQIYINGQCTSPKIQFVESGTTIYLPNLLIDNNHHLIIDVPSKQILYDGDINNSKYNYLSIAQADGFYGWPVLWPGTNTVIFTTADRDSNCYLQMTFSDEWI